MKLLLHFLIYGMNMKNNDDSFLSDCITKVGDAPWFIMSYGLIKELFPELSSREAEVSILYFSGLDTRSIAYSLNISNSTINNHLSNAKLKLGATNISELRSSILLRFLVYQIASPNTTKRDC
ncbi:LuxR family transcriptional regulator [Pectobacterium parmentieri]|uniref:Helix-turn-helix transcriptional regulator n=3 Tax=Pectobacterium TaxID=122277 RepID=A0ABS0S6R5_PECPM|nr:helix-turn-helix transcriptional regulator [Pectobacterium parmentieri]MBI0557546.1 helix-turn-helix transcriptional regulator [Pectobacterium parmentieri]MBI0570721.1 helix-turn-helix transcriptional regulator [Pectobacterium parmentieri]MBI0575422.1 helix-turn-helix transcriptional regulator [Pectobacterium parmentieri]MCL6358385.1 LuxR family transcriptional regulator [Pectobacterium parmentieri]